MTLRDAAYDAALLKFPDAPSRLVEDVAKVARDHAKTAPAIELDCLLTVLNKHGVSEYEGGSLRIKFAPQPSFMMPFTGATSNEKTEPEGPPVGAVEPVQHDINDVLFGAK